MTRLPVFHALTATAQEWRRVVEHMPRACVPLADLRFHGYHLPYGTDLLITTAVCEQLLHRFGGMLFPPLSWPAAETGGEMERLTRTARDLLDKGFHTVIFLGPPCRGPKDLVADPAAGHAGSEDSLRQVIITSLGELLRPSAETELGSTLETSLMMRLFPHLVKLPALDDPRYGTEGIVGPAPQVAASPQRGREWLDAALDILTIILKEAETGQPLKPVWYYAQKHREMLP